MKLILQVLLIFYSIHSFSQKKDHLQDHVPASDSLSKKVEIKIKSSLAKFGDSIPTTLSDSLNPSIFNQINKLDEVLIERKSEFNAVSLGIIKKEIKPLTVYERQLYTAGDFKPIHLLSILGGSLPVDPIINAITGRTKRLKKYISFEKKESNIGFLEDHFTEYMRTNLNISEEIIGNFLSYLIENDELQNLIDRKDFGELHFLIGDEWFKFESLQIDSSPTTNEENE